MSELIAPDFYLIGLPKAGTTTLYNILIQSPIIYDCPIKEPNFFLPPGVTSAGIRDPNAYNALYASATAEGLKTLDASVAYSHAPEAIDSVLAARPDARFLLVLRRPADLVYSQFQQMQYGGYESIKTLDEAWKNRIANGAPSEGYYRFTRDYPRSAAVGSILASIRARVPANSLHVIIMEEFMQGPASSMEDICTFLGVAPFKFEMSHKNKASKPRIFFLHQQIVRKGPLYRALRAVSKFLPVVNGQRMAQYYFKHMVHASRKQVPEMLEQELTEFFQAEIHCVEKQLGRVIDVWAPKIGSSSR